MKLRKVGFGDKDGIGKSLVDEKLVKKLLNSNRIDYLVRKRDDLKKEISKIETELQDLVRKYQYGRKTLRTTIRS